MNKDFAQHVNTLFIKPDDYIGKLLHSAVGMSGESGELLDAIKKVWIYGAPIPMGNIVEELGDLLFYMQAMINLTGITWDMIIQYNINKLAIRYPEGFTEEAARNRADKKE